MCSGPSFPKDRPLTTPLGTSELINAGNYAPQRANLERLIAEGGAKAIMARKALAKLDATVGKTPDPTPPPPAAPGVFVPQIARNKVGAAELKMPTLPVPAR